MLKISAKEILREKYAAHEKARLDKISWMAYVKEKGKAEGKAETLIKQLSKKFGILPASLQERIINASLLELDLLVDEIFSIKTIEEVLEIISDK